MTTRFTGLPDRRGFQVVVMAKEPVAGAVKTRLCPPLTHGQAAALARAALLDTMDAVRASRARRRVLALEGHPRAWCRASFDVIAQRDGDFGVRLAGAIEDAWARAPLPVLVIGMDTPQIQGPDLDRAVEPMLEGPTSEGDLPVAVLGPAEDGGYWAIGVPYPVAGLFDGVPMSTNRTCAAQLPRLPRSRCLVHFDRGSSGRRRDRRRSRRRPVGASDTFCHAPYSHSDRLSPRRNDHGDANGR